MPTDEHGEYQTIDEFLAQPVPIDTSPQNVARAVRFLEQWLPITQRSLGSAAHGDIRLLMEFAREHLDASPNG